MKNQPTSVEMAQRIHQADDIACNGTSDAHCLYCESILKTLRGGNIGCPECGHINALGHDCSHWKCDENHAHCTYVGPGFDWIPNAPGTPEARLEAIVSFAQEHGQNSISSQGSESWLFEYVQHLERLIKELLTLDYHAPGREPSCVLEARTLLGLRGQVPDWVRIRLQSIFKISIEDVLSQPSPSRDGVDAWTWVKQGHSWLEVVEHYEQVTGEFVG